MEVKKLTKEEAQQLITEHRKKQVQSFIDEKTERAAKVLHEVMDSESTPPIVRVTAAKDLLDRGGFKPVEKVAVAMVQPITGMKFILDDNQE